MTAVKAGTSHAIIAGIVCAVVGFTSSFSVVLAGLQAVGASHTQAASGLTVVSLTMGAGCILFSLLWRMPISTAWSTPGAALLATAAAPHGGFAAATGAFAVTGLLLALTGLIRPLGALVRRIPTPLANAMLAGVLLHLCIGPFTALQDRPWDIAPVILTWLVLSRLAKRWAVVGALVTAVIVMICRGSFSHLGHLSAVPKFEWVTPSANLATMFAIAIPLYIVTMTTQNIPGIAVLSSFGYEPPIGPPLVYTGAATMAGAPFGGYAINLAAISAALVAGPAAHPDRSKRWIAGVSCGVVYMLFGVFSSAITQIAVAAPGGIFTAIAGLALIGSFVGAAFSAFGEGEYREASAIAFIVSASGVTFAHIGAAFWGLVAGLLYLGWMTKR